MYVLITARRKNLLNTVHVTTKQILNQIFHVTRCNGSVVSLSTSLPSGLGGGRGHLTANATAYTYWRYQRMLTSGLLPRNWTWTRREVPVYSASSLRHFKKLVHHWETMRICILSCESVRIRIQDNEKAQQPVKTGLAEDVSSALRGLPSLDGVRTNPFGRSAIAISKFLVFIKKIGSLQENFNVLSPRLLGYLDFTIIRSQKDSNSEPEPSE